MMQLHGSVIRKVLGEDVIPWIGARAGFQLRRVSLLRLACPTQLEGLLCIKAERAPIVVVRNIKKIGGTPGGFQPRALVVSGAAHRSRMISAGHSFAYVWAEAGLTLD